MRMRNLGQSQSVAVFAPPEVHRSILETLNKTEESLDIADVVQWTLHQSCTQIETNKPLWVMRGLNHTKRQLAQKAFETGHTDFNGATQDPLRLNTFLEKVRDREAQSLHEMYLENTSDASRLPYDLDENLEGAVAKALIQEWRALGSAALKDSSLQEEQEREVAQEIEQEREIQRPPAVNAHRHKTVHPSIKEFVRTGKSTRKLFESSVGLAFEVLRETTAASVMEKGPIGKIHATQDFSQTVVLERGDSMDNYLRPVNWILVSLVDPSVSALIISPFEANELLPDIRCSERCVLHLYSPQTSKTMMSFSQLSFYQAPSELLICIELEVLRWLDLFAGALYLDCVEDYQKLCEILGVFGSNKSLPPGAIVSSAGFVDPAARIKAGWLSVFQKSPIPFVKQLLSMRRKGDNYQFTHMGNVINGKTVRDDQF